METIGRYRVIRPLGQGGMGAVYLCEDPTLERQVAIKLLLRDPSNIGLREEAKVLAALNHKGIVTIHEVGDHEGQDFLVMEYLPGKTLRELLEAGRTPRMTLLEICSRVAEAVAAAHRAGILHRDIKPENILVTEDEVKVLDFGIARRLSTREAPMRPSLIPETLATAIDLSRAETASTAASNTLYGTPAYMAPEVFHGEPSSIASDVYSLGIVVYECVAGRRPHNARTLVELIAQVVDAEPERLDDPQAALIAEMLSADPSMRPDLLEVSSQLAIGRTLIPTAPASTPPPRRARWPLAVAVLAIASGLGVWAWARARSESRTDAAPTVTTEPTTVAIAPMKIPQHLYGADTPSSEHVTAQLTAMLERIDPARFVAFTETPRRKAAQRVEVELRRVDGALGARVRLIDTATGVIKADFDVTAAEPPVKSIRLAWLLEATSRALVPRIVPEVKFTRASNPGDAKRHYQEARLHLDAALFTRARSALENALIADTEMFEAWYALAFVLAWQGDDEATAVAAHARKLAVKGSFESEVMAGVVEYMEGNYEQARAILTPLDERGTTMPFRRELLYFLGEAWWHDGHTRKGFELFQRAVEVDPDFRPVLIHMSEYAIVHRDFTRAALYLGISNVEAIDFAAGKYERISRTGRTEWRMAALEVLERPVPEELVKLGPTDLPMYHLARAVRANDLVKARELAESHARRFAKASLEPHERTALLMFGEVLLASRMEPETRRVLALLAPHTTVGVIRHSQDRLAILAAGLLRDRSLIPTRKLSYRNQLLATAIDHELSGARAKAVATLREVLAEPSFHMDLPEKAALMRNLRALGKTRDLAALCRDIRRPVSFRMPTISLQRDCPRR